MALKLCLQEFLPSFQYKTHNNSPEMGHCRENAIEQEKGSSTPHIQANIGEYRKILKYNYQYLWGPAY